jgi:hypothetical protein
MIIKAYIFMIEVSYPPYFGHGMLDIQVPSCLFLKYFILSPWCLIIAPGLRQVLDKIEFLVG